VPPAVTAWATSILNDSTTYPMFAEVHAVVDGLPVVAQVQHHTTRGATGETGLCIRGISVFNDAAAATASTNADALAADGAASSPSDGWTTSVTRSFAAQAPAIRTIELVFLAFVVLGTAYTLANSLINGDRP